MALSLLSIPYRLNSKFPAFTCYHVKIVYMSMLSDYWNMYVEIILTIVLAIRKLAYHKIIFGVFCGIAVSFFKYILYIYPDQQSRQFKNDKYKLNQIKSQVARFFSKRDVIMICFICEEGGGWLVNLWRWSWRQRIIFARWVWS